MAQAAGLVNVIVKNTIGFTDATGTPRIGDGATAFDVAARVASALSMANALVVASDVKIRASDFNTFVLPEESANRG